jgi:adenylate cyclase
MAVVVQFFRRQRYLAIWLSGLLAAAVVLVAAFSAYSPLDRFNALVFDVYQQLKPREPAGSPVVVVDIDDVSLQARGQWPWPRTVVAEIVQRLSEAGAAAVGFDVLFAEPDRTSPAQTLLRLRELGYTILGSTGAPELDNDQALAATMREATVVTGLALAETTRKAPPKPKARFAYGGANPIDYLGAYEGSVANLPSLDEAASGIGVISFPPGSDGIVRQIPLVSRYGTDLYPALSMELLRVAQGVPTLAIRSTGASGESDTGNPGMIAIRNGDFTVPTTADATIWVYYSRKPVAQSLSVEAVLDPDNAKGLTEAVSGRIVLIGTSAIGLRDIIATPLSSAVPGVFVHAEIIDQIVGGTFLNRPDWAVGAELVLAALLAVLVLALLPWLPATGNAIVVALLIAAALAIGWVGFASYHLLLSPVLPVLLCVVAYGVGSGVRLLLSEREKRFIRAAFAQYLAPSLVQQLVDNPQRLILGGENREITLLFCDIRSFTGISEGLGAAELTEFLNNFLTPMTDILMRHGATIDKYMGDAIMAFWNAPVDVPDHRRRACDSLIEMEAALSEFNRTQPKPVAIGVGVNTGVCCVGNLGSRQRFDYSAIGDPVNVASRTEGMTKQYGLTNLVTDTTAEGAGGLAILEVDRVRLYGRDAATSVYTILGDAAYAATDEFVELKRVHDRFLQHYRAREFDKAGDDLALLRDMGPPGLAQLYRIYGHRIAHLSADPPGDDWDGTYTAEHK